MAFTRTMGQLVGLCQRRADKEGDDHVDTDEWKELIAEHYGELHSEVVDTGARYFESEDDIAADGDASYDLPDDHFSTIGIDRIDGTQRVELAELMVQERGAFAGRVGQATMYSFTGNSIALYPTPSSGTYKHIYVPQPADYSAAEDDDDIDLINVHGMKFVVWGVASVALHKGEADQQRAMIERDKALRKLREWAVDRAMLSPKRRVITEMDLPVGGLSPADWRFR